jgi:hypothetical protein
VRELLVLSPELVEGFVERLLPPHNGVDGFVERLLPPQFDDRDGVERVDRELLLKLLLLLRNPPPRRASAVSMLKIPVTPTARTVTRTIFQNRMVISIYGLFVNRQRA